MKKILIIIISLTSISSHASAWGKDGHRIVCYMAEQLLSEAKQAAVNTLVSQFNVNGKTYATFAEGCLFPDYVKGRTDEDAWKRYRKDGPLHYVNFSRKTKQVKGAEVKNSTNIMFGIQKGYSYTAQRNPEGLFLLGHVFGDAHQPLHAGYADDLGGNKINQVAGLYGSTNLHAVWDYGIIEVALNGSDWQEYADALLTQIQEENLSYDEAEFSDTIIQESYDIATSASVQYCEWDRKKCRKLGPTRTLDKSYQDTHQPIVEQRLKMAAVRLAGWLDKAIHWVE